MVQTLNFFINLHKLLLILFTDDHIVLRTPRSVYTLKPNEKMAIAVYFIQQLSIAVKAKHLMRYLPDQIERWGKIRIIGESECVRSIYGQKSVGETQRDASFARVSPIYDIKLGMIPNHVSSIS